MQTILIIDQTCYKPYDRATLFNEPLGGTEATVVRIAEGLSKLDLFKVYVEQRNRTTFGIYGATYIPPESMVLDPRYVICLRDPNILEHARTRYPKAKLYLWSHDLASSNLGLTLSKLDNLKLEANIVVSNYHKQQTMGHLLPYGYTGQYKLKVLYNPIDDDLEPRDQTKVDKNKLIWFSSPHKGLDKALEIFKNLQSFNKDFRLFIANPGYFPDAAKDIKDSITILGPMRHRDIIQQVRYSLCVFYPNVSFPETFGLVFAEANAVGVPVLAHDFGAAREVLDSNPDQLLDCRNPVKVIDRVMRWYKDGKPTVSAKPQFRLARVIKTWVEFLTYGR